jgi:hypothetical protein
MSNPFTVTVQRDHFRFDMKITESSDSAFKSYTFEVESGDETKPCLKLYVRVPATNDERIRNVSTIASLLNVEALLECSLDDINENYMRRYHFGDELLATVNYILKRFFPHVKSVELYDASYLPCNRAFNDVLDLLTYSIAIYGKTWYETKLGAYPKTPRIRESYKQHIAKYVSERFKSSIHVDDFLFRITVSSNTFARAKLNAYRSQIESMYTNAPTFPSFFQSLRDSDIVPRAEKCKFFKGWLETFIGECVPNIDRNWQYDLYPFTRTGVSSIGGNNTQHRRRSHRRHTRRTRK